MSMVSLYTLPPNVKGKIRDIRVKIELRKISGPKGKAINFVGSSGGINVKFIWWGESQASGAVIKYQERTKFKENNSQSSATIEYAVLTNIDLFRNYLARCEPIEVQLTSSTSNLQLGTAFVPIPTRLSNLDLESFEETVKSKIFSPRNVCLGDITLGIGVFFGKSLNSARSTTSTGSKISCSSEKFVQENIPPTFKMLDIVPPRAQSRFGMSNLDSARSFKSFREKYSAEHKDPREVEGISRPSTSNPSVVDYLSGCPMSRKEEELALDEIRCISPLTTLVTDILSSRIRSSKSSAKDILGKIDSLRLGVKYLKINSAGMREISTQSLAQTTFTIECRISPNLLDNVRARYDYDVMRFYSDNFDDCDKRVDFNRDALRSIRISRNEYTTDSLSVGVEQAHLLFSIWWREYGTKHSRCLGTTQFRFTTLLATNELEQTKKLAVKSCLGDITVGYLIAKVTLGTKGVHFGPDFLAFYDDNESNPKTPFQDSSSSVVISSFSDLMESPTPRKTPTSSNPDKNAANDKSRITINRGDSGSSQGLSSDSKILKEANDNVDRNNDEQITQKTQDPKSGDFKLLQGLLFVGRLRNVQPLTDGGYFLVCHAFWKEDVTSTDFCRDDNFNFLEIFPIMNDNKFLDRARNNHLTLELWQKTQTTKEQMVGVVKLPLHQFFIAFRDAIITNHLSQIKLPVISIDGWVPVASPLAGETCGQLQTLLAIGTEEQLEYLKASRSGLSFNSVNYLNHGEPNLFHVPVPQIPGTKVTDKCKYNASCDAGSQTSFDGRRERLSDLLGTFIDNLAQQLPQERLQMPANNPITEKNSFSLQSTTNPNVGNQIRKTSDLLDVLQQALVTPPLTNLCASSNMFKRPVACPQENQPSPIEIPLSTFKILLEIENALHLPRNRTKIGNKKNMKRNSVGAKCKQPRFPADEEPSAYVTFQAEEGYGPMIKSHEGLVYATNIVEKSCNPVWNKRFEIVVPVDLFVNDEKRFILKIWRKAATDSTHSGLVPSPLEDSVIGFSAVDLNVLLAGLPCISGWFNVVDFNGRINGQIKVNVRPLDDIQKLKNLSTQTPLSSYTASNDTEHQYSVPLPDDGINKGCPTGLDLNNSSLSRAIKRKFTELEEITQRLKARLFDVTGEPESLDTTNIEDQEVVDEQLDEFERDLNTVCEEEDDAIAGEIQDRNNFGWLGFIPNEFSSSEFGQQSSEGGSSIAIGNDSQERIQVISESLKNADLNACVLKDLQSASSKFDGGECGMGSSCTKFTKNQSV